MSRPPAAPFSNGSKAANCRAWRRWMYLSTTCWYNAMAAMDTSETSVLEIFGEGRIFYFRLAHEIDPILTSHIYRFLGDDVYKELPSSGKSGVADVNKIIAQ